MSPSITCSFLLLILTIAAHGLAGTPLSLLMLDIDQFKDYNDACGHLEGGQCLKAVAGILKEKRSRATDFACHYRGEEFLVPLGNTGTQGATIVAEKTQAGFQGCGPAPQGGG